MRFFLFLAAILLPTLPAHAAAPPPASLFFSADDAAKIAALEEKNRAAHPELSGIHLGAVFYYGPDAWTIWLQGTKWVPGMDRDDLHIIEVESDRVRLVWQDAANAAHDIMLRPYQTFQISTGRIVEGAR